CVATRVRRPRPRPTPCPSRRSSDLGDPRRRRYRTTGFMNANGEQVPSLAQVRMSSNSFLRALVCEPSVLSLAAEGTAARGVGARSEEHTSELQSRENLVCRLLLEKK